MPGVASDSVHIQLDQQAIDDIQEEGFTTLSFAGGEKTAIIEVVEFTDREESTSRGFGVQ